MALTFLRGIDDPRYPDLKESDGAYYFRSIMYRYLTEVFELIDQTIRHLQ